MSVQSRRSWGRCEIFTWWLLVILRVVDAYYECVDQGYRETMPVLHVFGRDTDYRRHHLRVDEFRPYFCVRQSEWVHKGTDVAADDRVLDVKTTDRRGRPETAPDGEPLVRLLCRDPSDVSDLRELFDDPFEADVLFPVRFLVDFDADQYLEVPDDVESRDESVSADELSIGVENPPADTPPLRVCTYDIEVQQGGAGPSVVSEDGTEQARNPITAITAHDSYTDEYKLWVMMHDSWDADASQQARDAVDADVSVYRNPRDVVSHFCEWVTERDFDALTGWAASGFDHPYLVNYALNNNLSSVYDLSPTGDVYEMSGDGSFINSALKGRLLLDGMVMYEKTNIHELDSKRLVDVAEAEGVSVGKLDIEGEIDVPANEPAIDYAWAEHPDVFTEYSLRDVQATVAINRESKQDVNIV